MSLTENQKAILDEMATAISRGGMDLSMMAVILRDDQLDALRAPGATEYLERVVASDNKGSD